MQNETCNFRIRNLQDHRLQISTNVSQASASSEKRNLAAHPKQRGSSHRNLCQNQKTMCQQPRVKLQLNHRQHIHWFKLMMDEAVILKRELESKFGVKLKKGTTPGSPPAGVGARKSGHVPSKALQPRSDVNPSVLLSQARGPIGSQF